MDLTRSEFLRLLAGTGIGTLGLSALGACDGSDAKNPDASPGNPDAPKVDAAIDAPPPNCMQNGTAVTIANNHGHSMTVSKADVMAGVPKDYNIKGVSAHPHTVTVTAAMFALLQQNMEATATSSTDDGHPHNITIKCT
jgi:hypothetical protein